MSSNREDWRKGKNKKKKRRKGKRERRQKGREKEGKNEYRGEEGWKRKKYNGR